MKLTKEILEQAKKTENFSDGIILPDGDYQRITEGHLKAMMALLPYTEEEVWKMIPEKDSPLFWVIEKTGCVATDYNSSIGMEMTQEQKKVFDLMVESGLLSPDYFNLTKQRERAKQELNQNEKLNGSIKK